MSSVARGLLSPGPVRLVLLVLALLGSACAVREPSAITAETDSAVALARRGSELFRENCNVCHPGGGKGVGPAIERSIERESAIQQIRTGIGTMPAFSEEALDPDDVDALLAYIDTLVSRARIAQNARAGEAASHVVEMIDALGGDAPESLPTPDGRIR